jgi:hypothetical protein
VAEFGRAVQALGDALRAVDVGALTATQCASLLTDLAQVRKACEAVEVSLAARAASSGAHRRAGYAAPQDWLAAVSGTTAHAARVALETVAEVEACPETRDALFEGRVSMSQAHEIALTEQVAPGNEAALAELAAGTGLRRVREVARELRAGSLSAEELHRHQQESRSFVSWRDELGMVCGTFKFTPEVGTPVIKRIERAASRLRRETKSLEPFEALAADALASILRGSDAGGSAGHTDLVLVCDIAAWLRKHGRDGEVAKIVGGGPLPVSVIEALSENAFLKVVLHDGVQVQVAAHYGRSIPAHVRTALELGFPPEFDGPKCSDPNCDRTHHLEREHDDPVANGGVTNASNLQWKCTPDHDEKTKRNRAAGRLGGRAP